MSTTRRCLVGSFVALAVVLATIPAAAAASAPAPRTPIRHFISLMQENHTFDNYFGKYPGADGIPSGTCMPIGAAEAALLPPFHIGDNSISQRDLDHSRRPSGSVQRRQIDGFIHALKLRNQDGRLAMGYRDGRDLAYYWNLADKYVLYDRFFSSAGAGSFLEPHLLGPEVGRRVRPGSPKRLQESPDDLRPPGGERSLVEVLRPELRAEANSGRTINVPGNRASQVIWVPLLSIPRVPRQPQADAPRGRPRPVLQDAESGTLPEVAYIAPSGPSEHPPSNIPQARHSSGADQRRYAEQRLEQLGVPPPYDDWGGWYDHVKPPQVDQYGYGFRVPSLLVSPYARKGYIEKTTLDFTSILRFIEDNWELNPSLTRDAHANSIASGFDFGKAPRQADSSRRTAATPKS